MADTTFTLRYFTGVGDRVVAHGGMSVEEVIVPFVRITQKSSSHEK